MNQRDIFYVASQCLRTTCPAPLQPAGFLAQWPLAALFPVLLWLC